MKWRHHFVAAAAGVAAVLLTAACGGGGHDDHAGAPSSAMPSRTVDVVMVDTDFNPASIEVEKGETVRFVFTNRGTVVHDAFVGDRAAQQEHDREMAAGQGHSGHGGHGGADAVSVDPGATGELIYTFDESADLEIGCHQPGHYVQGMKIDVRVS